MRKHRARFAAAIVTGSILGIFFVANAAAAQQPQAPAQQPPQPAPTDESPSDLFVTVGKSLVVNSALPIQRVSVGFGDIAEATPVGIQEVLVNGKAPGETSLIIWQQGGTKLFFDVTVQPSTFTTDNRAASLRRELNRELPGQTIEATIDNDLIFLRGTAKDLTSAERAFAIASSMGKAVNLLNVEVPPPDPQVLLKVKFASVDRTLLSQAGMNLFSTGAANTIGSVTTQQFQPPFLTSSTGGGGGAGGTGGVTGTKGVTATLTNLLNLFFFRPDLNLGATISALEQKGVVEVLAEPNVLTQNGKQGSFLAGGEFPYPVVQGGSIGGTTAVTVQFRQFGVRLNFIPTITPRGTIRLQVNPEVSSLDYAAGVNISGFTVPGLDVRDVNTEVELGEGQSFAIGGLLDNRETETFSKIPFIGSVPVLGRFFQSRNKNRTNSELMVIVTPELVRPAPKGTQIATPNMPVPFLPPNSTTPMTTPSMDKTGPVPVTPPNPSVPVETLIQSLQENQLQTGGSLGQAQAIGAGVNSSAVPAAPAAPAPAAPAPAPAK